MLAFFSGNHHLRAMTPPRQVLVRKVLETILECQESGDVASLDTRLIELAGEGASHHEQLMKVDDEQRMVYGWASVATVGGVEVVDKQGDVMSVAEMRDMAHDFVGKRILGVMHGQTVDIGEVRDTVVLDKSLQDALGIDLNQEGWFLGVHVKDDATWQRVKNGELQAFSIGGDGVREPMAKQSAVTLFDEIYAG
jgi:hypothetical protein